MARSVTRRSVSKAAAYLNQYLTVSGEISLLNSRKTELRDLIVALIDDEHETDPEKGHLTQALPNPLNVGGKTYVAVQKQRKVTQTFDEDAALELLKSKDLPEEDYMTPVLDQDKVARLYADDVLSDEEFENLFEEKVSYAFHAVKE